MIVIGSTALALHVPGREAHDVDLIGTREEADILISSLDCKEVINTGLHKTIIRTTAGSQFECELVEHSESGRRYVDYLKLKLHSEVISNKGVSFFYSPADVLFSIKRSHIHYPKFFEKHIKDYHDLKKLCKGVDRLADITNVRRKETALWYGKLKTPSLMKKSDAFFDDKVSNHTFVHDDIHKVMAHREHPMYTYIQPDESLVLCSKDLWMNLSDMDKTSCVLEEAYVIALERVIIPMLYAKGPGRSSERAFKWALMRICTTLCSGWFREYAMENYFEIMASYNKDFVTKFLEAVETKKILKINETRL